MKRLGGVVLCLVLAGACGDDDTSADASSDATDASASCTADSECDDGLYCTGVETCSPDDDDADALGCIAGINPCPDSMCDEGAESCGEECPDADGDGRRDIACGGDDCDDADANRFPGNPEVCDVDDKDEDCDPSTFGFRDADMDGSADASCCNGENCGPDCDDMNPGVHSALPEVCDRFDNDCDGDVDEGVTQLFYPDEDGDGFGAEGSTGTEACSMPGASTNATDCNDEVIGVNPAAFDRCDMDMVDDDCDGVPNNPEGGCDCTEGESRACPGAMGVCAGGSQTCVGGTWSACDVMARAETCNGLDDDCNGEVDDGLPTATYYLDNDRDTFGDPEEALVSCETSPPMGYVTNNSDCWDANDDVFPGQTAFFTVPFAGRNFDYNCDDTLEREYREGSCRDGLIDCSHRIGHESAGVPACGRLFELITSCDGRCDPVTTTAPMGCR